LFFTNACDFNLFSGLGAVRHTMLECSNEGTWTVATPNLEVKQAGQGGTLCTMNLACRRINSHALHDCTEELRFARILERAAGKEELSVQ